MQNFFRVIVINGPARSGKDTLIEICRSLLKPMRLGVETFSAIDEVKVEAIRRGWWDGKNETKTEAVRQMLSNLKHEMIADGDRPTKYLCSKVQELHDECFRGLVFLHCREPEEIDKLREQIPNLFTLHVYRPGHVYQNGAENVTFDTRYHLYIDNCWDENNLEVSTGMFLRMLGIELPERHELRGRMGELKFAL